MKRTALASTVAFLLAGAGLASAQDAADEGAVTEPMTEIEEPRMTLPASQLFVQAFFEVNLSSDLVAKPVSLAPDIWYGVNEEITVGLAHSSHATTGFFGGAGDGLCFTGEDNGCADVLQNPAIVGRYHLMSVPVALAVDAGLVVRQFSPFQVALKAGVVGKWKSGAISVLFAGNLFVGVTEREGEDGEVVVEAGANKEEINLPVAVMYALNEKLGLGLQSGLILPLQETGDTYLIPLSLGARYMVSPQISADLLFSFPALVGGPEETGADLRVLTLGGGYVF